MAVSEFALVSLKDAKNFLGLNGANSQRDKWLEGEIQRQTARVEGWLDRKVKARFLPRRPQRELRWLLYLQTEKHANSGGDLTSILTVKVNSMPVLW